MRNWTLSKLLFVFDVFLKRDLCYSVQPECLFEIANFCQDVVRQQCSLDKGLGLLRWFGVADYEASVVSDNLWVLFFKYLVEIVFDPRLPKTVTNEELWMKNIFRALNHQTDATNRGLTIDDVETEAQDSLQRFDLLFAAFPLFADTYGIPDAIAGDVLRYACKNSCEDLLSSLVQPQTVAHDEPLFALCEGASFEEIAHSDDIRLPLRGVPCSGWPTVLLSSPKRRLLRPAPPNMVIVHGPLVSRDFEFDLLEIGLTLAIVPDVFCNLLDYPHELSSAAFDNHFACEFDPDFPCYAKMPLLVRAVCHHRQEIVNTLLYDMSERQDAKTLLKGALKQAIRQVLDDGLDLDPLHYFDQVTSEHLLDEMLRHEVVCDMPDTVSEVFFHFLGQSPHTKGASVIESFLAFAQFSPDAVELLLQMLSLQAPECVCVQQLRTVKSSHIANFLGQLVLTVDGLDAHLNRFPEEYRPAVIRPVD